MGRRIHAVTAAALVVALAPSALAESVFTGPEVEAAKLHSIDIIDSHLYFMAAQARVGKPLTFVGSTVRWAPGSILMNTGERVQANLSRTQIYAGSGGGSEEDWALFGGMMMDFARISNPFYADLPNFNDSEGGEGEVYIGGAFHHVQITLSGVQSGLGGGGGNRDPWGNFWSEEAEERGLPPGTVYPPDPGGPKGSFAFVSAYESRTGAFLSLAWDSGYNRSRITDVRAHLQPLSGLIPDEVREIAGLPALGLRRLAGGKDYYSEAPADTVVDPGDPLPAPPEVGLAKYETDFGADDVLEGGFRWRTRWQVSPSPAFRLAELGYVEDLGARLAGVRIGARALLVHRASGMQGAGEGYVLGRVGRRDLGVHLGASYSYDVPDGTTFLPIRRAHVFGLQFVFGSPDASRPLVPLVREVDEHTGAAKGAP